ncbi:MAG: glycosyltransferase [Verrucomicrobia bacterium]|nr:glycosyltransferase [Leptolyngbya sp. ES-bin-22]
MAISRVKRQTRKGFKWQTVRPRTATLVLLGTVVLAAGICAAWFIGEGSIDHIFAQLNWLQGSPPLWLATPMVAVQYLSAPTVVLLIVALVVMKVSPEPRRWSRAIVVSILLALTIRYIAWRSLTTLNLSTPLTGFFSLGLFLTEMLVISNAITRLFLMLRERDRRRDADHYAIAVAQGTFSPSVAILIPTHSEPSLILRRTIIGCQALDYPHKAVYLLDDGKRSDIQALAAELGCHYIARPFNQHAKAGNLNYAIGKTDSDLITVFDADFIPTRNFLTRTVGFFQNQTIGIVQTHQCFYNPDSFARNLGLEKEIPHENEAFGRHYLPIRDGSNSALCYGSSFVVRRSVLQEVGGFATQSVSEDLFTGIRIAAKGYQVAYLNESLSAGLVPEDMPAQVIQRQRWTRGSIQAFFLKESPFTIPGLSLRQRIAYLEGIFQWFNSPARLIFLILPIAVSFLQIAPISTTIQDWSSFYLPLYLIQLSTFSWLNHRASPALIADVYSVMNCFPVSATIIQTLLRPFSKGFRVTPKGTTQTKAVFNWQLALPLIVVLVLTIASLIWQACMLTWHIGSATDPLSGAYIRLGLGWGIYNVLVLAVAILSFVDIARMEPYEWLEQQRAVHLEIAGQVVEGMTTRISEIGAEVTLFAEPDMQALLESGKPAFLTVPAENLRLSASMTEICFSAKALTVKLVFERATPKQLRRLIEWVFCQPGQWQPKVAPGELRMAWLLLRTILRPRALAPADRPVVQAESLETRGQQVSLRLGETQNPMVKR